MTTSTASRAPSSLAGAPARALAQFSGADCLQGSLISPRPLSGLDSSERNRFASCSTLPEEFFGARSIQMRWTAAALGLVFHFTIAFTAAAVYYLASRAVRAKG